VGPRGLSNDINIVTAELPDWEEEDYIVGMYIFVHNMKIARMRD
jgi:hypothetical protein